MKIHLHALRKLLLNTLVVICCSTGLISYAQPTATNPATASFPIAVGRPCGGNTSTWSTHVFQYNGLTTTLSDFEDCKPTLGGPGFSISAAGISYNPADHRLYYYRYTGGNTYVWRWTPGSGCPPSTAVFQQYNNAVILGFAFAPDGLCYQLIFTGSGPYGLALRTVDFTTGTFGPQKNISLPSGVSITQQSGDMTLTPDGQMLMVWDKHYMTVNYTDYPTATPLAATLIADLTGNQIVGLNYAEGKVIAADDNNKYWDLNILTGVKTAITQSPCYQSFDLTEIISGVGVAKKLSSATPTGTAGTYNLSYDITVKNTGGWDVSNVQVIELLRSATASAGVPFTAVPLNNITNVAVSWVYNPLGLTLNSAYTGLATTGGKANLLAASQTLPNYPVANSYFVVRVSFTVSGIVTGTTYNNNARVTANGYAGKSLEDVSTDGDNPDLNNNSKPDDPGEDHSTPFVVLTAANSAPCNALNKILYLQTFGTGSGLSTAIPAATGTAGTAATDYTGSTTQPIDIEKYALATNANQGNTSRWVSLTDHTNGSGKMMVVNGDVKSNKLYTDKINISCGNLRYSLFAFVSNISNSAYGSFCDAFGGIINPKLIFTVRNAANGNIITNLTTPDITSSAWTQYGMKFVMPSGISQITIEITNAAAGGCGNDVAIDDVQFGLCDPSPIVAVNATAGCTGGTTTFNATLSDTTVISGTVAYQWQVSSDNVTWSNIALAYSSTYTINPLTASDIGKYYRVLVSSPNGLGLVDVACSYTSNSFQLTAKTPSTAPTSITSSPSTTTCPGNPVTLSRIGGSLGTNAVWRWYRNSCGDTLIGTGTSISVTPSKTTTYYVRAEGDCNTTTCAQVTITVTSCVVLPVDFLQFNAVQQTSFVDLNWKIVTSEQLSYFDVERSTDGINFSTIGKVNTDVSLNSAQSFNYKDVNIDANSNTLYYRINAVSKDGGHKYSAILMVRLSNGGSDKIKVSPNPATSAVSLSFSSALRGTVDFQLMDMTGKVVLRDQQRVEAGQNVITISQLNQFSEGVYTILIRLSDRWERERIIIKR
ncbi:MAG: T9SS type A sorting domain-containing protein [Agriterribacter sp.]